MTKSAGFALSVLSLLILTLSLAACSGVILAPGSSTPATVAATPTPGRGGAATVSPAPVTPTSTPTPAATATPIPKPIPLTLDGLKNAEYQSAYMNSKTVKLADGRYSEPGAAGSVFRNSLIFGEQYAFGDLNGDGMEDAAVILAANTGGSGVFMTLAAMLNDKGTPRFASSAELGDRELVKSITIQVGVISVSMTKHGPNDPLCCPTLNVTERYKLEGGKLVLQK